MSDIGLFEKSTYGVGNRIVYSNLNTFDETKVYQNHIGIKYVIEGSETYFVNKKEFNVRSSQYLLINPEQSYSAHVRSKAAVTGICLNVDTKIINDVFRTLSSKTPKLLDNPGFSAENSLEVLEGLYDSKGCPCGNLMQDVAESIQKGEFNQPYGFDLFCKVAEKLLGGQNIINEKLMLIDAGRWSTKKELYRRVERGRRIIENTFCGPVDIEKVAGECYMSPFHFSRTFKQIHGYSPYQFMIYKRLELAKLYLTSDNYSVTEVAHLTGFADIHSFSKAFKKAALLSPSKYRHACELVAKTS